jgi:uncharacterized protein (DUF305 family)
VLIADREQYIKSLAEDSVEAQEREIVRMREWLKNNGK